MNQMPAASMVFNVAEAAARIADEENGVIAFDVYGRPAPQGSRTYFPNGGSRESSKAVPAWREAVRSETQRIMAAHLPLTGAVEACLIFILPKPASTPRRVLWPIKKKDDVDKLSRAVLDGLTDGSAFGDDGQVCHLDSWKRFGPIPAVRIRLRQLTDDEAALIPGEQL